MFYPKTYSFGAKPDGRRPGPAEQEVRRKEALKMRDEGVTFTAIAKAKGVHPRTVQYWCAQARAFGADAVIQGGKRGAAVGDGRVLGPVQEREIVGVITTKLPGMQFRLWCVEAILELIRERFKMQISRGSVGNYLVRWGIKPQISESLTKSEALIRWIRERAQKEKALIFWAGEMTPPFWSEPAGKLTNGNIPMLYARIGKGEIHFMFETDELRDSGRRWSRFVEELSIIAWERRSRRKAFVLLPRSMGLNKELSALYALKTPRTPQSFEIFFV